MSASNLPNHSRSKSSSWSNWKRLAHQLVPSIYRYRLGMCKKTIRRIGETAEITHTRTGWARDLVLFQSFSNLDKISPRSQSADPRLATVDLWPATVRRSLFSSVTFRILKSKSSHDMQFCISPRTYESLQKTIKDERDFYGIESRTKKTAKINSVTFFARQVFILS